jgi:hypothetical protein
VPWIAGQSRVVMAAVRVTAAHVSELSGRSRRASGREAGGRRASSPQFGIQSECALTSMNACSRRNLTRPPIEPMRLTKRGGAVGG